MNLDGFEVRVFRKKIKNMHLRVQAPDGSIEVSVPLHVDDACIEDFVRSKRSWIEKRKKRIIESPYASTAETSIEQEIERKMFLAAHVPALVEKWEPLLGVKAGKLAYRSMKSRWGSCQPATGRICINTRLALYPLDCLEYVVVHELCHLRVSGHDSSFWELMDTYLPYWRESRAQLRS